MRSADSVGVLDVGRKPKAKGKGREADQGEIPTQYNIRLGDADLARRVHDVCGTLGLDGANFLRMMIRECLTIYEQRAQRVKDRKPPLERPE
jgi:hypothetical protein